MTRCHKINSHEINCHQINYHKINLPQDQLSQDQVVMKSTPFFVVVEKHETHVLLLSEHKVHFDI